jgi:GT2 family glycosyltransferase
MTIDVADRAGAGTRMTAAVTVIVVNFNGGPDLARCLESLIATAPAAQVIVVDNGSTDGSAILPAPVAAAVRLLRNATNIGYAAALNQGVAEATGELLVFSNMDMRFDGGWLEPLAAFVAARPDAGAVNPLILLADSDRVNAAGQDVHVTGLGFNRGLGDPPARYGDSPFEVAGIQGALFAMRREVYDAIGGLDATGFLYHEDVNVSWLLRLAGYRLYCVPTSRVRHDYFLSMHPEKFHLLERNRVAMVLGYLRPATLILLLPLLLLTESYAWAYALLRGPGFVAAKWRSYQWIRQHRPEICSRRKLAARLRRVSDLSLLRTSRWAYDWRQFSVLARERGRGRREPGAHP